VLGGLLARALPVRANPTRTLESLVIEGELADITQTFGARQGPTRFRNAGYLSGRQAWTMDLEPAWDGPFQTLGDILESTAEVPNAYFLRDDELASWSYLKGGKREQRVHKGSGTPYHYVEGPIPYPDRTDTPARTILTGEGGRTPSRFKHVIRTDDGRLRRLTPRELERLNGFPDDWTNGMAEGRRAFMMGNSLVVGLVERIGRELMTELQAVRSSPVATSLPAMAMIDPAARTPSEERR
jgi:DNA (cytosine-5)-methyltransferase 1